MNKPLFTMAIAAYNNYKYLREAVDSVLNQTYENIEIIISNDGSKDFNEVEIAEYIDKNKGNNITNVIVNNFETNQGTVKNVNYLCKMAKGTYIMFMAADDALYNENVIAAFVDSFENENSDRYCICGKVAMCGTELDDVMDYVPSDDDEQILRQGDSKVVFSKLARGAFIPTTSCCYKKSVFELLGYNDEKNYIIEDYSFHVKMALNDYRFGWVDNLIGARHRDGGISHGNTRVKSESYRRYRYDEIQIIRDDVLPNLEKIFSEDKNALLKKWEYLKQAYYLDFIEGEDKSYEIREYDRAFCEEIIPIYKKKIKLLKITRKLSAVAQTTNLVYNGIALILALTGIWGVQIVNNCCISLLPEYVYGRMEKTLYMLIILMLCFAALYFILRILLRVMYDMLTKIGAFV